MTLERLTRVCYGRPYKLKREDIVIPWPLPSPHTEEESYIDAVMAYNKKMTKRMTGPQKGDYLMVCMLASE